VGKLGGPKKKSIAQVDKTQEIEKKKEKSKEVKTMQKIKRDIIMPNIDEEQAFKIFEPMKAITIYSTAKAFNIKGSVASVLLRSLESKGFLKKFGGYSGHYVYTIVNLKKS